MSRYGWRNLRFQIYGGIALVIINYSETYHKREDDVVIFIKKDDEVLKLEEDLTKDKYYKAAEALKSMISGQFNENKRLVIMMPKDTKLYINTLYELAELIEVKRIEVITKNPPGY